ncbi:hypothetical protein BHE74_00050756 [Ensete ventricosum]|nr:hypothetical protein BHE74_00050756 [Ensete ventricosum]
MGDSEADNSVTQRHEKTRPGDNGVASSWRVPTCKRADPQGEPTITRVEMRVRSGGTVSRKTISTVRWEEDTAVLLRQRQKAKGAPKSNGCHGSGQVSTAEEKQRPREIGHQKTIILTASGGPKSHPSSSFSLLSPSSVSPIHGGERSRRGRGTGGGGDGGGGGGGGGSHLSLFASRPFTNLSYRKYRQHHVAKAFPESLVIRARHEFLRPQVGWAPSPLFSLLPLQRHGALRYRASMGEKAQKANHGFISVVEKASDVGSSTPPLCSQSHWRQTLGELSLNANIFQHKIAAESRKTQSPAHVMFRLDVVFVSESFSFVCKKAEKCSELQMLGIKIRRLETTAT